MKNSKLTRMVAVVFIVLLLLSCFMIPCSAADPQQRAQDIVPTPIEFARFCMLYTYFDISDDIVWQLNGDGAFVFDGDLDSNTHTNIDGEYDLDSAAYQFSLWLCNAGGGVVELPNLSQDLFPKIVIDNDQVYMMYELVLTTRYKITVIENGDNDYVLPRNNDAFVIHMDNITSLDFNIDTLLTNFTYIVHLYYPLNYMPDLPRYAITLNNTLTFGSDNMFSLHTGPFYWYDGFNVSNAYYNISTNKLVFQLENGSNVDIYDSLTNTYLNGVAPVSFEFDRDSYFPQLDVIFWILENTDLSGNADPPLSEYYQGFEDGWLLGYEQAKLDWEDIYHEEGYRDGYEAGKNYVVSETFAQNTLIAFITAPVNALDSLVLFEYGATTVSLWDLVMVAIGFSLFIWFLKLFAGG